LFFKKERANALIYIKYAKKGGLLVSTSEERARELSKFIENLGSKNVKDIDSVKVTILDGVLTLSGGVFDLESAHALESFPDLGIKKVIAPDFFWRQPG
jgi:hypothetical protein